MKNNYYTKISRSEEFHLSESMDSLHEIIFKPSISFCMDKLSSHVKLSFSSQMKKIPKNSKKTRL